MIETWRCCVALCRATQLVPNNRSPLTGAFCCSQHTFKPYSTYGSTCVDMHVKRLTENIERVHDANVLCNIMMQSWLGLRCLALPNVNAKTGLVHRQVTTGDAETHFLAMHRVRY